MRKRFVNLSVFMIFLIINSPYIINALTLGKNTLKGIRGIQVVVENLNPDIEKDGLSQSTIQKDIEDKLSMAGIKVFSKDETRSEPGRPYLYILIQSYKQKNMGIYAVAVRISLKQLISLARDPSIVSHDDTWKAIATIGFVGEKSVDSIRKVVQDHVDEFIKDFVSMNPGK